MNSTYRYPALPEGRNIRVLHLYPGSGDEPLNFELIPLSLEEAKCLQYEALSYVWGEKEPPFFIECENELIKITKNCHEALQHLRLPHEPRTLWIDAICIDQSSITERSHQVGLMGEIYRNAEVVIGWLGPATEHTVATMWILGMLAVMEGLIAPTILLSNWLYEFLREMLYSIARFCHSMPTTVSFKYVPLTDIASRLVAQE
jgi:hypothetical protein